MSGRSAAGGADRRFLALGDEIPPLPTVPPGFSFVMWRRSGSIVWLSGHGPSRRCRPPQFDYVGKVGSDLTPEEGAAAARLAGLNLLVTLRDAIGSLDRVSQVLRLDALVASAPGFTALSAVANGCSDLLLQIFGPAGAPARLAFGAAELPFNMAVEAAMTVEISEGEA